MNLYQENFDPRVGITRLPAPTYSPDEVGRGEVFDALKKLADQLEWCDEGRGPFGKVITRGARVLIKPNFVLDRNQGPWGMEPMVTHQSVVKATVTAALLTQPAEVLVGDAPIQSCNFDHLLEVTKLRTWADDLMKADSRFKGIKDFRRTTCEFIDGVRVASENLIPEDHFVLFDLSSESLLEPITNEDESFRVTCYDPRLMARTHAPGRHRYLVAKDVLEADVVINLPKLKTHKKAGVTCALKNLIGINGNKEYLPHHRLGGANLGGDCYPGDSRIKRMLEYAADQQNLSGPGTLGRVWGGVATQLNRMLHLMGDNLGIEGSWSGNDTIWRTGLDLNRILLYGRLDGSMADDAQRRVIHVVDAIVAGQGDGPLAPQPLALSLLFGGSSAAAVDWIGAQLLGYDPEQISIVREAFGKFRWPLTSFTKDQVVALGDWDSELERSHQRTILYPEGWCDLGPGRNLRSWA
jgi:uncharacterized protein (DUF362 family)